MIDTPEHEIEPTNLSKETTDTSSLEEETEADEPAEEYDQVIYPMTNSMDGALIVYVPEGEFLMGSEYDWNDEQPEHTVYVDAFWIYQYSVTNRQFADYVDASRHQTLAEEVGWGLFKMTRPG